MNTSESLESVKQRLAGMLVEDADKHLETARRAAEKARKKADDTIAKMEEEMEKVGGRGLL